MNYQAVARDAFGKLLAKQPIALKISFSTNNGGVKSHYSEIHQVITDELGLFSLVIGEGKESVGALTEVPWSTEQIWLQVELDAVGGREFALMGSSELRAVPYAFHAATASQLVDESAAIELPTEKNQSIYWHTGGNTATRPAIHFLGTRDNQDLVFKTNNTTRVKLTKEGQLKIFSGVKGNGNPGDDANIANYPLLIEGSDQGIYIKVNGSRDGDNNFLTFADDFSFFMGTTFFSFFTTDFFALLLFLDAVPLLLSWSSFMFFFFFDGIASFAKSSSSSSSSPSSLNSSSSLSSL
jgi:hypothetical protein